ncbi:MAG: hypothetical protein EOM50_03145 [Erysipelotrichia bacterium]|nr:hypothetical protein [Erysipelotrichia bacterium]NCC55113.1 hypothetical protein [Erysipelotrichia bacterium]
MKKKIMIIGTIVVVLLLSCILIFKKDPVDKQLKNIMKDMKSYCLTGDMEISKGEDIKAYSIEVGYKKVEKDEFFRVGITDKELNQTQVILRNQDGVYVITPTLNQIFKFEGDWPLNSLKPYLIQSMVEIMKNKDCVITNGKNNYIVESKVNYPNNNNFKKQKMQFDDEYKIQNLEITDDSDVMQLKIVFDKVDYDAKLKKDYFALPSDLQSEVSSTPALTQDDLPLYPMTVFDSTLSNASEVEVNNGYRHVLEYKGDRNFTLIESVPQKSKELQTVIMSGEFVDSVDAFGFYDGNHMVMMNNGVEYTIYSDDLTPAEMVDVLSSMQVVVMK